MRPRVYAWMERDLVTVAPSDPMFLVVEAMAERRLRHVLVVDEHGLCGIVSNRDLIRGTTHGPDGRLDLHRVPVRAIMTAGPLHTIHPHAPLSVAARTMVSQRVSALPVLVRDRLVGVITSHDLLLAWESERRLPALALAEAVR